MEEEKGFDVGAVDYIHKPFSGPITPTARSTTFPRKMNFLNSSNICALRSLGDIIMPIIGAITGGLDLSNYYTSLSTKVETGPAYEDAKKQGAVLGWGHFLTVALNFLIIAGVLERSLC